MIKFLVTAVLFLSMSATLRAQDGVYPPAQNRHVASLSLLSYGAFINSYFNNDAVSSQNGYKWASYSKWLHLPAMVILPIAGSIAQRQFGHGKKSATGVGSAHKPAALGAIIGMALTTLSLTFEF